MDLPSDHAKGESEGGEHAESILRDLSSAITSVLTSVPGKPSRPVEVMRVLDINRKSSWQISTVANAKDPGKIASAVPGRHGFSIFLEQARKQGVANRKLEHGLAAFDRFEELVQQAGGSRSDFEQALQIALSNDVSLTHRKSAKESQTHILSVEASIQHATSILNPNADDPDRLDIAMVGGFTGFRFKRNDINWRLGNIGAYIKYDMDQPNRPTGLTQMRSIFPPSARDSEGSPLPIVDPFSSVPLPTFTTKRTDRVTAIFLQASPKAQLEREIDCYLATLAPAASLTYGNLNLDSTSYTQHSFSNWLCTPVDYYCFDLVVPQGLWKQLDPRHEAVHLYNTGFWDPIHGIEHFDRPHLRLELDAQINPAGPLSNLDCPPGAPKYKELLGATFDKLGWNQEQFEVYRMLIRYPPIPIVSRVMFDRVFVS
ncbi:MAG: hypothetical protein AAGB34_10175 [Planctomycetota bacterium]